MRLINGLKQKRKTDTFPTVSRSSRSIRRDPKKKKHKSIVTRDCRKRERIRRRRRLSGKKKKKTRENTIKLCFVCAENTEGFGRYRDTFAGFSGLLNCQANVAPTLRNRTERYTYASKILLNS